jgi:hypothetical protein
VSVAAAAGNPCLLVTLSQATAILGAGTEAGGKQGVAGVYGICTYTYPGNAIGITLNTGPTAVLASTDMVKKPFQAAAGVGHGAVCGADASSAGVIDLISQIDREDWLVVSGPSCAVDGKFAEAAYGSL